MVSASGARTVMPALAKNRSRPPNAADASSTRRSQSALLVASADHAVDPCAAEAGGQLVASQVGGDDGRSLVHEQLDRAAADAARGARHDRHATGEPAAHAAPPIARNAAAFPPRTPASTASGTPSARSRSSTASGPAT